MEKSLHSGACGCGHDHHEHSHDEHCGCGHDHHEHSHDEHCGCGHDHHEHSHDEHCGHDHHEHSHETAAAHGHVHGSAPKTVFLLENLGCAHCAAKMEEKINALPGVEAASLTYATKQLWVYGHDAPALLPKIQDICTSIESQVKVSLQGAAKSPVSGHEHIHENKRGELASILTGAVLFAAGVILSHLEIGENFILPILVVGYLILGGPVLLESLRNIRRGQIFDENFLMSVATLAAFCIRDYPEAVGIMLFYRVGEYFEHRAVERSRSQIMDAVDMRPEVVNRIQNGEVVSIPAEQAMPGDVLLIRPGDRIPLDGTILEGESRIDTSPITGEPVPVAVRPGDALTSGCVNTSGQLKMAVEKPLSESMVTRILNSVESAAASKPKIDKFITRFAKIYTPCVVGGALAVAIIPSLFTGNWYYWIYTAVSFLVMSCPCALVLSVPLAFFSGIGAGSKQGILFKGGVSIEALGKVKAIVMDKTGTVTEGNFRLQEMVSVSDWNSEDLLRICAGCEQNSTHPIAVSIVNAAREKDLTLDTPLELKEIAGQGISARMPEGQVLCGNKKLMNENGIALPASVTAETRHGAEIYLAVNGTFAGYALISDTIKKDSKAAIRRLKEMGLYTVMLTGDSEATASAVAAETGIDEVHARLLPHEKLEALSKIRAERGAVLFVGDGINDAPVLAGADVGAAMGNGADAAIEAADAVFMKSHMEAIPVSIAIARATSRISLQNVVFALAVKLFVMILGLVGFANMWMAVFADTGVALICILNSIRLLYQKSGGARRQDR